MEYASTQRIIDAVIKYAKRISYYDEPNDLIIALMRGDIIAPIWEDYGMVSQLNGLPQGEY